MEQCGDHIDFGRLIGSVAMAPRVAAAKSGLRKEARYGNAGFARIALKRLEVRRAAGYDDGGT